jgi:hypothetical protein
MTSFAVGVAAAFRTSTVGGVIIGVFSSGLVNVELANTFISQSSGKK